MTMLRMRYIVGILMLVIVLLGAALWVTAGYQAKATTRAVTAETALKASDSNLKASQKLVAQAEREKSQINNTMKAAHGRVQEATEASPEYRATPVPPAVQQALLEALEGLE